MSVQELNSKAFKRAESHLQNCLKYVTFFNRYPHHFLPGCNLNKSPCIEEWNEKNAVGLYQEFPYNCDLPKPLLPPAKLSRTVLGEEDPALQLLTLKSHLKHDINRITTYCKKHKQELGVTNKKDIKWSRGCNGYNAKVPRYIADIAELIEMDPDPYFDGTYNWYYTGGSLNHVHFDGWDVLLFPYMGELVAANIVSMDNSIWKPLLKNSAKCKLNGLLYEIRQNKTGNTYRILGRQKNQCALYTLSCSENQLILNEIHRQASKIPYVSADLSLTNANYHCTLNAERTLFLWDITKTNYVSSGTILQDGTHDAWGCVRFQQMEPNTLVYIDRCCLRYLDIRIPFNRPSLTLCPKYTLQKCESLSMDAASKHGSYRYIGTYHSLLMCDNRSPKQCVQQKWTHQFKNAPLLASVTNSDNKEIIVLSSQTAGENAIILNTWMNQEESHSFSLPFRPPCIAETLNGSRMGGMCLDPYLQSRFELSNVGSALFTSTKGEVFSFTQNSIGDIFYQCVTHENILNKDSVVNRKACYALSMWEKALLTQTEPLVPLTITDKCNMQHVYKSFTNRKLRLRSRGKDEDDPFEPTWKQSLAKLESYVDILAPELLAVWEIREEVPISVLTAPHQKVLNWLESAPKLTTQSQDELECIPTPVNTQELISISQDLDIVCIDDSNALQDMLLPKVISKSTKKKKV